MSLEPQEKKEELRQAVRAYLAERPAAAQSAATIARGLRGEHACSEQDVQDALLFLADLGHVASVRNPLGSTVYWRATAAGILAYERDG